MGEVEPLKVMNAILRCENLNERDTSSAARMVLLRDGSALPNKASGMTEGPESTFVQKIQEPLAPLSEHLTGLNEGSVEGKTEDKKRVFHWLLLNFQEIFPQNENDLGQTSLGEHTINTGDAKPIKQPPHHLPKGFAHEDHKVLAKIQAQGVI